MYGYMREYFAYDKGDYHVSFSGCSSETIDKIKADERVSKAAVAKPIGYAEAGSSNADKPYLYVLEADESFMKNMPVHLTSGRLPENENEIILPEITAKKGQNVLLSPASASFDCFRSYEERGERFKELMESFRGERVERRTGAESEETPE